MNDTNSFSATMYKGLKNNVAIVKTTAFERYGELKSQYA